MMSQITERAVSNQGVVVTGAGRGIGRAIAAAFVDAGARVVINDLDPVACAMAAEELGAIAVPGDAASADGVAALIDAANSALGDIDVFCANAGVAGGIGLHSPEKQWSQAFNVNVMGHVRAAQLLVPGWVERGGGRFISVASAAGLLTMLGSAPYAVSKHAAVAFAEWLALTYQHLGIQVHVVCPQWVETDMLDGARAMGVPVDPRIVITTDDVAQTLMGAIEQGEFLVLPHPEVAGYYQARASNPQGWIGQMNEMQRRFTP